MPRMPEGMMIGEHIAEMESYIGEATRVLERLRYEMHEENGVSYPALDGLLRLATVHGEAACILMAAEQWEMERMPLIPPRAIRRVQDTPLPDLGGPLDGPGDGPAPTAPPAPATRPTDGKEE